MRTMRTTRDQNGLRISRFLERTETLGPGLRAVVWFQGCTFDCAGCIAVEMNRSIDFTLTSPTSLANRILEIDGIEGVTLSGGDPFDQPLDLLAEFVEQLRRRSELTVMCYTGRTLDQLVRPGADDAMARILKQCDILIDGLYVESMNEGSAWRGSSNQVVHFLSPRYRHLEDSMQENRERQLNVTIGRGGAIDITGIPPTGFMDRLRDQLNLRGLALESEALGDLQSEAN